MDVRVSYKLIIKKNHPCVSNEFTVLIISKKFHIHYLSCEH